MKKSMMIVVLVMVVAMLTACGNKKNLGSVEDLNTVVEDADTEEIEEDATEDTEEVAEEEKAVEYVDEDEEVIGDSDDDIFTVSMSDMKEYTIKNDGMIGDRAATVNVSSAIDELTLLLPDISMADENCLQNHSYGVMTDGINIYIGFVIYDDVLPEKLEEDQTLVLTGDKYNVVKQVRHDSQRIYQTDYLAYNSETGKELDVLVTINMMNGNQDEYDYIRNNYVDAFEEVLYSNFQ
jgi:uncharacterized protein YxeA